MTAAEVIDAFYDGSSIESLEVGTGLTYDAVEMLLRGYMIGLLTAASAGAPVVRDDNDAA